MLHRMGRRLASLATVCVLMASGVAVGAGAGNPREESEIRATAHESLTSAAQLVSVPSAQTDMTGRPLSRDFYFYRGLLSEDEQKAYDALCDGILRAQKSIPLDAKVDSDRITSIIASVYRDHPEIFWSANEWGWTMAEDHTVVAVEPRYSDLADSLDASRAQFEKAANPVISFAAQFKDPVDKVRAVHDWLTASSCHDPESPYNQTAWSVFVNGRSVCAGYASAFQYVLQKLGIPTAYVTGTANGEAHAWNLVLLDGQYYAVDATFDDPMPDEPGRAMHGYFLVSDAVLAADHARDGFSEPLPVAEGTLYDGAVFEAMDLGALDPEATSLPRAYAKGDVAGDGQPSLAGVMMSMRYVEGLESLTDAQRQAADMNGDGRVALSDVLALSRMLSYCRPAPDAFNRSAAPFRA